MRPVDVKPFRPERADRIVNEQRRRVELGRQRVEHHAEPLTVRAAEDALPQLQA
jgi:hypothetical protein